MLHSLTISDSKGKVEFYTRFSKGAQKNLIIEYPSKTRMLRLFFDNETTLELNTMRIERFAKEIAECLSYTETYKKAMEVFMNGPSSSNSFSMNFCPEDYSANVFFDLVETINYKQLGDEVVISNVHGTLWYSNKMQIYTKLKVNLFTTNQYVLRFNESCSSHESSRNSHSFSFFATLGDEELVHYSAQLANLPVEVDCCAILYSTKTLRCAYTVRRSQYLSHGFADVKKLKLRVPVPFSVFSVRTNGNTGKVTHDVLSNSVEYVLKKLNFVEEYGFDIYIEAFDKIDKYLWHTTLVDYELSGYTPTDVKVRNIETKDSSIVPWVRYKTQIKVYELHTPVVEHR